MKYGQAIKLFFQDENWISNAFVGFVILLIPVVGQLVLMGWHCEIAQRLVRKEDKPIPKLEFGDFMTWLERGVGPFVANLIVTLPLSMVIGMVMMVFAFAMPFVFYGAGEEMVIFLVVGFGVFGLVFGMVTAVFTNAAVTRAELTGDLAATLRFQPMLRYLRDTFWDALIAYTVFTFLAIILTLLGMLALFIGVFVMAVALGVAQVSIRVQLYERNLARGGEEIVYEGRNRAQGPGNAQYPPRNSSPDDVGTPYQ